MLIAVVGAGAMGCLYGGLLARSGADVTLIARKTAHVEQMNKEGLRLSGLNRLDAPGGTDEPLTIPVRATTCPAEIGPADLVILCVKATDTAVAAKGLGPLLAPHTSLLTLQNGLGNAEILAERWGAERVLVGTSSFGALLVGPGSVRLTGRGQTHLGEPGGLHSERIVAIATAFNRAGLNAAASGNVTGLLWDKLLINVGINALTTIAGIPNGKVLESPALACLMTEAVAEAAAVATAAGIVLSPAPVERAKAVALATAANRSSMLRDMEAGRVTEIDAINGAVARYGRRHGVATPVNETLTLLVNGLTQLRQLESMP
ncbi:2-dehydropantoate 2-reductase [Heliobacterium gestii]|uniref:2-dehydropantoate 2-reductase n=1 Tax=Heliomicrobium gestii TaxID=2699 RepID=A0A845LC73_HELGE|nr:2-dehydropantoate 2-reductase [Heliomicrobium gestii]MBM7866820.1 2-dehydropantoate 2-reductase [Heliomicrobium gestii]MZP42249.1 2-dehydropantoate 2-reductase [Heliomicrobium gestii]